MREYPTINEFSTLSEEEYQKIWNTIPWHTKLYSILYHSFFLWRYRWFKIDPPLVTYVRGLPEVSNVD